jgi:hypothetical protein
MSSRRLGLTVVEDAAASVGARPGWLREQQRRQRGRSGDKAAALLELRASLLASALREATPLLVLTLCATLPKDVPGSPCSRIGEPSRRMSAGRLRLSSMRSPHRAQPCPLGPSG